MNTQSSNCILFFLKAPTAGKVKTRLAAEIGEQAVVGLYRCFVEDLLATVEKVDSGLRLCIHPPGAMSEVRQWLGDRYSYRPQRGDDLGQRLKNAFAGAFEDGFSNVVAIGSDSPDLPEEFVREAFVKLESHDAVIGPASDGGYYLIGFSEHSFVPEAFENVAWSTSTVCDQTRARLAAQGMSAHLLPLWHDVDRQSDLDELIGRNGNTPFRNSRTFRLIRRFESHKPES